MTGGFSWSQSWLAANAPSLSAASYVSTLPESGAVPVCLAHRGPELPGGGGRSGRGQRGADGPAGDLRHGARVGETQTASETGIADTDGLTGASFAWQWIANDGTDDADIADATGASYTLTAAEQGKTVKVRATFTDDGGTEETLVSAATEAVAAAIPQVSITAASSPVRPAHHRALARLPGGRRLRPYAIAGVPYPERTETQHTIVSGTTGSGETVLISDLVSQIRARGERCVIYDKMGSYTRSFFDEGRDVLLNPLDARAPRWSPFYEARNPRDFDMMAAALIPQQKDTVDPFWVTATRQLFSNGAGVLRRRGVTENRVLVDHLLKTDFTALAEAMEGTVAQSIVDPENPKTALSVRAMLTANLSALEFLPDEGAPFSIREWISDEARDRNGGGFLFLTSRGDQHASLRGLISTWLEIAVNAMLSLDQDDGRRIWVILDELPTLHQVPSLQPGLAESRQFGGCFVLGVQVASALRDLYGRNGAETISGLCGTVHAFQGRTVDTVIAAMEANHPHLTTQKSFYVEISRARDRAELVTGDRAALQEQLEAATGERIAALEAVGPERAKGRDGGLDAGRSAGRESDGAASQERGQSPGMEREGAAKGVDRGLGL